MRPGRLGCCRKAVVTRSFMVLVMPALILDSDVLEQKVAVGASPGHHAKKGGPGCGVA